jgi:hypothetical protein
MSKTIGQKISYVFAMLSFAAAFACAAGALFYRSRGDLDPILASLMASTVFFVGCGIVLYVIATARLKGLLSRSPTDGKGDG